MPTATETNTTLEVRPLAPSRRALFVATILTGTSLGRADLVKPAPLPWRNGPRPTDDADAELIALCDRLAANQYRFWAVYSGPGAPSDPDNDPVVAPQLDALDEEWHRSKDQVMRMVPTTLEGARAMARYAFTQLDLNVDYRPFLDDLQTRALLAIAAWLADDAALMRDIEAGLEAATPIALPGWGGMTPTECYASRGEVA